MNEKNRILKALKQFVFSESAWLTPDDQRAIEIKIDELDLFIDERYKTHGRTAIEQ